ncbi:MAG TPA: hypothetical protein VN809_15010 [Telmatospirillum sp.]|nr:hypothetical protein [Telmatospirillum sp.]
MIYRSFLPALAFAAMAVVSLPAFAEEATSNFLTTNDSPPASAEDATPDWYAADNSTQELTPVRPNQVSLAFKSMHLSPAMERELMTKLKAGEVKLVWLGIFSSAGGAISVTTPLYTLPYKFPAAPGSVSFAVPVAANSQTTVKIHVTKPLSCATLRVKDGDREMPPIANMAFQVF